MFGFIQHSRRAPETFSVNLIHLTQLRCARLQIKADKGVSDKRNTADC